MHLSYLANIIIYLFLIYLFYYIFLKGTRKNDLLSVKNVTKNRVICSQCIGAFTFARKVTGLLNHTSFERGQGLFIEGASSVHVSGMKFPIDILFIDKKGSVVSIFENVNPTSPASLFPKNKIKGKRGSHSVLELPAGTVKTTGTSINDLLLIK